MLDVRGDIWRFSGEVCQGQRNFEEHDIAGTSVAKSLSPLGAWNRNSAIPVEVLQALVVHGGAGHGEVESQVSSVA